MRLLTLLLLFALPAPHIEKGSAKIEPDGKVIVRFKNYTFSDLPKCMLTKGKGKVLASTRESVHILGTPGEKVEWRCEL